MNKRRAKSCFDEFWSNFGKKTTMTRNKNKILLSFSDWLLKTIKNLRCICFPQTIKGISRFSQLMTRMKEHRRSFANQSLGVLHWTLNCTRRTWIKDLWCYHEYICMRLLYKWENNDLQLLLPDFQFENSRRERWLKFTYTIGVP